MRGRIGKIGTALLAAALAGCRAGESYHAAPTPGEVDQIQAAAVELGAGRVVSVRAEARDGFLPVRIGILMPDLTEKTSKEEILTRIQPLARRARRILRRMAPRRDLRFTVYSPADGVAAWLTFRVNDSESPQINEVTRDPRILSNPLFSRYAELPRDLRRGFYLPFIGLPEVALSYGAKEAAYLDLDGAAYDRIRPQLEALACGGSGNPSEMRTYGMKLKIRSVETGAIEASYRLKGLAMARSLAFSPDGRRIAFLGRSAGAAEASAWRVWLLDRSSGRLRPIFTPPQPNVPRGINSLGWSFDGSMLAAGAEALPPGPGPLKDPREWVTKDRVVVFQPDGKEIARFPGRCPAWNPRKPGLLLIRDVPIALPPPRRGRRRSRIRWVHRILQIERRSDGRWAEKTSAETDRWVFSHPLWLRDGKSYLTLESLSLGGAYGWRDNGLVLLRSEGSGQPKALGNARLTGAPDGSAFILRSGRTWRWVTMPSEKDPPGPRPPYKPILSASASETSR
jgi:hypothetical protein